MKINYIWVGMPVLTQGGQDVIGPVTLTQSLVKFPLPTPTSIVFWCLAKYLLEYKAYFIQKGIDITVCAIESLLEEEEAFLLSDNQKWSQKILPHYKELTALHRGRSLDNVFLKEMIALLILATEGGWVLDTNVQTDPTKAVILKEYAEFKYPLLAEPSPIFAGRFELTPEVWMQYSPPNNLTVAKKRLDNYLQCYEQFIRKESFVPYSEEHHHMAGKIAVKALLLDGQYQHIPNEISPWKSIAFDVDNEMDYAVPELGAIFKAYGNSHRPNYQNQYNDAHAYLLLRDIRRLIFALDHGIPINVQANVKTPQYHTENEELLHLAMRLYPSDPLNIRGFVEFLLERHANPNVAHLISYAGVDKMESALTYAIKACFLLKSLEPLALIFTHKNIHLDSVLNNQSPIIYAQYLKGKAHNSIKLDVIEYLLQKGANPDQKMPMNSNTALLVALNQGDEAIIRLLLKYKADPLAALPYALQGVDQEAKRMPFFIMKPAYRKLFDDAIAVGGTNALLPISDSPHAFFSASASAGSAKDILLISESKASAAMPPSSAFEQQDPSQFPG